MHAIFPNGHPAGRWRTTGTALALALLALTGCGEPDTPTPASTAPSEAASGASPEADAATNETAASTDGTEGTRDVSPSIGSDASPNAGSGTGPGTVTPTENDAVTGSAIDAASAGTVDCASRLPCRFDARDGGLSATLTAADGEQLDGSGPLRVDVVLEARSRDATVTIESTSSIVSGGQVLDVDTADLGGAGSPGARDETSFPLIASVPINGHVAFRGELLGNPSLLDRVTLQLGEAGTTLAVTFADVPLGPEPGAAIDCRDALPCLWTSADALTTLALTDATPLRWNRATRLVVSWRLETARPLEVVLAGQGRVTDGAGETLEPYGAELGGVETRDGTVLTHALGAGERVAGRTVPRRAPEDGETTLARVEIAVTERRSPRTPRWRPVFLNVPLRAADGD